MNTRSYKQRARAETAEETRRRILDAMYARLRAAPAETISLDLVARSAGVARSTIYQAFGSRAGLYDALFRYLLDRAGFQRIVEAVGHPDAREHLRGSLRAGAEVYAAERDVIRSLISMAALNPDAYAGMVQKDEQGRAEGMRYLAGRLGEQGILRQDTTVEEAADLLFVLTSFDAFDLLFTGRGCSVETVAERLIAMAERALYR